MVSTNKYEREIADKVKSGAINLEKGKQELAMKNEQFKSVVQEPQKQTESVNKYEGDIANKVRNNEISIDEGKKELEAKNEQFKPVNQSPVVKDDKGNLSTGFTPLEVSKKQQEIKQVQDLRKKGVSEQEIIKTIQDQRTTEQKKLDELKVKEQEHNIKVKEQEYNNQVNQQTQEQYTQGFQDLVSKGATTEDLAKYLNQNKDLKEHSKKALMLSYKEGLKIKEHNDFVSKYGSYNDEQLYTAYKNGEIIPGSDKYNLLSPEQKASFETYKKQADTITPINEKDLENDKQILSFEGMLNQMKGLFNTNIRQRYESVLNTPEITQTAKDLEVKANAINKLNKTIKGIEKDVQKEYPHSTGSLQASIIADRTSKLRDERDSLVLEYDSKKGTLATLKDDANRELQILQLEDAQNKQIYMTALNQYNTDRNRMDSFKKIELQEQSKLRAEARQRDWQLAMKENDRKYAEANKKGIYKTDADGNLLYLVDGQANIVKSNDGKVVAVKKYKDYTDTVSANKEGGFTILRQYENGKMEVFTRGIDGKDAFNTNMKIESAIGNVESYHRKYPQYGPGYQCGEAVNNYLKSLGISSIHMGTYYKDKTSQINSKVPVIGGLAVWQAGGVDTKYGHTGIVTGYNEKTKEVLITDWNLKGKGEKNTHKVPVQQILNSDGGFVDIGTQPKPTTGTSNTGVKPLNKQQTVFFNQQLSRFRGDGMVKTFEETLSSQQDLLTSLNSESGPGDVAAIFQFMKSLDPRSVVRESEFELAGNTAGISAKPGIIFNKLKNGKRLNDIQRKEFGRLAKEYVKNKGRLYDIKYNDMQRALKTAGIEGDVLPTRITSLLDVLDTETPKLGFSTKETPNIFSSYAQHKKKIDYNKYRH